MAERIRSRNFLALSFIILLAIGLAMSAFLNAKPDLSHMRLTAGYGVVGQHWTTTGVAELEGKSIEWEQINCNADAPAGTMKTFIYGKASDQPIVGDWNGNGTVTVGVKRGDAWYLRNLNNRGAPSVSFRFGISSDQPLAGRWLTRTGRNWNPGVHRRNTNWWFLRNSQTSGIANISFQYGTSTDAAFVGDWDGNGTFTPGVRRGNTWYLRNSNTPGRADVTFTFALSTDHAVVGDWDGNFTWTTGVFRGHNNVLLRNSNSTGPADLTFALQRPEEAQELPWPEFPRAGNWDGLNSNTCKNPTPV